MTEQQEMEPGQPWEVFRLEPKDAEGVARLFRAVYGDGYPIRTYVEPELLVQENASLRVVSSVARTPRGDIVGHSAIYNSAPHPGVYESGAVLIHPAYQRRLKLFPKLLSHSLHLAETLPEVEVVFGESVCNHTTTQKISAKLGSVFTALEADLMPAEAYEMEGTVTGRVATLLSFKIFRQGHQQVFLPQAYSKELPFFYEDLGRERCFVVSGTEEPAVSASDITHQVFDFAHVARIAVRIVGRDFSEKLSSLEKELTEKGVIVFQVWLNLADPGNGGAVDILRKRGYFIGGVLPCWFASDGLLMQKVRKRPDWEAILTASDRTAVIVEKVKADWERSLREAAYDGTP